MLALRYISRGCEFQIVGWSGPEANPFFPSAGCRFGRQV